MATNSTPLSLLEADLHKTLNECAESGEMVAAELPNRRFLAIHPIDPSENDKLVDDLLMSNQRIQELVAKSKASPQQAFSFDASLPDH